MGADIIQCINCFSVYLCCCSYLFGGFVGIGGNLAGIDAILAGQETMTVAVDGYDVGYLGVQAAVDALNGKTLEKFIATDATVVTAENAAERRAEVEKRLGTS